MHVLVDHISRIREGSFFKNTLSHFRNYLGTSIATRALAFIAIPVLTRVLSPDEYGTYSVFLSYIGICTVVLTLNLHASVGRYFYEEKDDFDSFLGTSVVLTAVQFCISTLCFLLFRDAAGKLFGLPARVVVAMPLMILASLVYSIYLQIFQALKESRKIRGVTISQAYLTFGAGIVIALLLTRDRYLGLIWGHIVVGLAIAGYLLRQIAPYFRWKFDRDHVRYIVSYSIPLIPYTLSSIILDQFDRIMINNYSGSASAGLYSFAYNIGMLLNVFSSALYQAWMPDYFDRMNKKDLASLDLNAERMFRIIVAAAAFLMFFGRDIGILLANRSYHDSLHIVPIVVLGYVFYAMFPLYAWSLGYARKTFWASFIVLVSGAVNIVLNRIYLPRFGYEAAAYTTLASFVLMALFAWAVNRFVLHLYTTPLLLLLPPLGMLLLCYGAFLLLQAQVASPALLFVTRLLFTAALTVALFAKYLRPAGEVAPPWSR